MGTINKIAVIGAGNMGSAIVRGILQSGLVSAENISVSSRTSASLDKLLAACPGIYTCLDNVSAASGADLIVVAVKPWQMEEVLKEIKPAIDCCKTIVASVAAGICFEELGRMLKDEKNGKVPALIRLITNTAVSVMKSCTFVSVKGVSAEAWQEFEAIFSKTGMLFRIEEEMMAAGTSLASCGIAYALKYLDASVQGGVNVGFGEEEAREIVIRTMEGAIALLKENGTSPQEEIEKVTTPGGYTARGLTAMENNGFTDSVIAGITESMS